MSTATNGTATAEEEVSLDPYELARRSGEADQTRERDRTDLFRRQNTIQYAVIAALSLAVVVLACTHKVEVKVVYDQAGRLVNGGTAADIVVPSDANIGHALADYVTCIREVTNDDTRLDECHQLTLDIMTQNVPPNGHAHDDLDAYYRKNNPKWLAHNETRMVVNDRDHPVVVQRVGNSNTFFIRWIEKVHDFQHGDSYSDHTGSVVIAPPFVPTDNTMLQFDPSGVIVTQLGLNV